MDAVAVETVFESRAECSDRARAEAALADALGASRAPRRSDGREDAKWRVVMQVTSVRAGAKAADAQILDDAGKIVAERTVADRTVGVCLPLARAVGAWAQIVLDDELARPEPPAPIVRTPDPPTPALPPVDADRKGTTETASHLEAGATLYIRNGAASNGGVAGVAPFLAFEIAPTWFLRPSLAIGSSTSRIRLDPSRGTILTHVGMRLDACKRFPGNYVDRRGIELDTCAGADVGYVVGTSGDVGMNGTPAAIRVSVGPALTLRGEIGDSVGLELRGMTGLNLARGALLADGEPPLLVASGEIGASVRFR